MPRSGASRADAELIAACAELGLRVSPYQLERWRTAGWLPRNSRKGLGRGRGSQSAPPGDAVALVARIVRFAKPGRAHPLGDPVVRFVHDYPVPEQMVRAAFLEEISTRARQLQADAGTGDQADDARYEAAHRVAQRTTKLPDAQDLLDAVRGDDQSPRRGLSVQSRRAILQSLAGGDVPEDDLARVADLVAAESDVDAYVRELHDHELSDDDPSRAGILSRHMPTLLNDYRAIVEEAPIAELRRAAQATYLARMYGLGLVLAAVHDPERFADLLSGPGWFRFGRFGGFPGTRRMMRTAIVMDTLVALFMGEEWVRSAEDFVQRVYAVTDDLTAVLTSLPAFEPP